MKYGDILAMAHSAFDVHTDERGRVTFSGDNHCVEEFATLVAEKVHKKYNPIGTVAGGATERTFMHPSVKFILPTGLQLYARIEVREEDKL